MHAGLPHLQERAISFLPTLTSGNNCPNGLYWPPGLCTLQVTALGGLRWLVNRAWPLGSYLRAGGRGSSIRGSGLQHHQGLLWDRGQETPALSSDGKGRQGVGLGQVGGVEGMLL